MTLGYGAARSAPVHLCARNRTVPSLIGKCLEKFAMIANQVSIDIDPDLVERFTGQRRVISVGQAAQELYVAMAAHLRAQAVCSEISSRCTAAESRSRSALKHLALATLPERFSKSRTAFISIYLLACAAPFCMSILLSASEFVRFGAGVVGLLGLAFLTLLFPSNLADFRQAAAKSCQVLDTIQRELTAAQADLQRCHLVREDAMRLHRGLIEARDYPLNRLSKANYMCMTGPGFEHFLFEVLSLHGWAVRKTGRAGDQGVDLVATRGSVTVAIQAKRHNRPVGNAAIQQVYTGMKIHSCSHCAVITTSGFTRGATEAAQAVGCTVISGLDLYALIESGLQL
jgi:hypothetical protein